MVPTWRDPRKGVMHGVVAARRLTGRRPRGCRRWGCRCRWCTARTRGGTCKTHSGTTPASPTWGRGRPWCWWARKVRVGRAQAALPLDTVGLLGPSLTAPRSASLLPEMATAVKAALEPMGVTRFLTNF